MDNFARFEAADNLDSEEMIAEYLTATLEDKNPDVLRTAVADVAKARGIVENNSRVSIDRPLTGLLS